MEIIELNTGHIPIIQTIAADVWPKTFAHILSPDQIRYMMDMMYSTDSLTNQMVRLGHHYILAREGGENLGYLSYEVNYKGKSWTKIHKIYVLPSTQGGGVGRLLIERAELIARQNSNAQLSLNVNRQNGAVGFYQRMGFQTIAAEDIEIGDGFLMEDYVMNKTV